MVRPAKRLRFVYFFGLDPPEVSVEKVYHHVPLGESVTLICFVFANPQPKVKINHFS